VAECLPLDPRFAGSNPADDDGIFKGNENPWHDFFQMGSKSVGPVSYIYSMFKNPTSIKEILQRQNSAFPLPCSSYFTTR
jgi:hypothetical protein